MIRNLSVFFMIFLLSTTINAQNDYNDLWKQVHDFELDNLPKSALKVVDDIHAQAARDKNSPQLIKCLFYKSKFSQTLEEEAQLKIINSFKAHIAKSDFPTKQVLQNVLASLYWKYFSQHRWQFYKRTRTAGKVDKNDFRTWDVNTLFEEIQYYYNNSLTNEKQLQNIDIYEFKDILYSIKGSKEVRPTLYDFLAHKALEFYKTDENNITKPAYKFKIDNSDLLSDAKTFSKLNITTKDTLSLQFNALRIYQELTAFHLKNKNLKALATIDLERLSFVNKYATFNDKKEYYLNALKTTINYYAKNEVYGLYAYEIARIYQQEAIKYQAGKSKQYQFKNKEALTICEQIIKKFPKSDAAKKCEQLKQKIFTKSLEIVLEEFVPSNQFSRLLVNYRNVKDLHFSIYRIDEDARKKIKNKRKEQDRINIINKLDKVQSWRSTLKSENDYQQHSTEIIVPKLPLGNYLLVASIDEKIAVEKAYGFAFTQVTDLTFITYSVNNDNVFKVVNRITGEPFSGVKVNLSSKTYSPYETKLNKDFVTDKNGEFIFNDSEDKHYGEIKATVTKGKDIAVFRNFYFNNPYREKRAIQRVRVKTFLFTDRSIYRPGQTIFFKGISMETFKKESEVMADEQVLVKLKDVNNQTVKKMTLNTNEFGSFSGEFVLPSSGLTGNYSIVAEIKEKKSYQYISVEEYKRPKFEADFKPITDSYKINETVSVKGFAKSFSGAQVTNAKVVYRVHREVQYPNWWYWRHSSFYSEPQEIKHGELTSDEFGNFTIDFIALADESVDPKDLPVFTYEVTADVTDVNGETRSATTHIKVGYHSLLATVAISEEINTNEKSPAFSITTKNLNGEIIPATGSIKIYKLIPPTNPLRNRPWQAPDYQVISKEEFNQKFPFEAYKNEDEYQNWKKGALVFLHDFNTEKEKEIKLKRLKKWQSGKYIVELESQDKFKQKVTDKAFFTVVNEREKLPSDNQLLKISTDKKAYEVGDQAEITISSNATNLTVMLFVEKQRKVVETHRIHLNKSHKTIRVPVTKNDEGGFGISYHLVHQNEFKKGSLIVNVPYPKNKLEIITKTFRDKLQPGDDQKWSFTIKGAQKDKVFAEVLASMYDASLDEFKEHGWSFTPINRPKYYLYSNANAHYSFQNRNIYIRNLNEASSNFRLPGQSYDKLNWFGFDFNGNIWKNRQYLKRIDYYKRQFEKSGSFTGVVSGNIKDMSENLPGVSVLVKGKTKGTETDFDGNFSIKVAKNDVLVFSYVGFETIEVTVDDFSELQVQMLENSAFLDEVVVVAQGISRHGNAKLNAIVRYEGFTGGDVPGQLYDAVEEREEKLIDEKSDSQEKERRFKELIKGVQIRKNLQETAFFFPHLTTDKKGNVSFNFTIPEALTRWKLQLLAHTKELYSATQTLQAITQKELMIVPNAPRFLRQGDTIVLNAKISNVSNKNLQGEAHLILTNAVTGEAVDLFSSLEETRSRSFNVDKNENTNVSWKLEVPNNIDAIQYKVVAKAGDFSDGEQNALPILTNRTLVTETLPMWVRSNKTKTFRLDKLRNNNSTSLKNHKLTLEVTSNPAWYAVQALPYLMEYPYECSEQTFARYYANTLASHVVNSNPRIQEVFNSWKSSDALLSNLEKNQELKSLIIQETPWLRDAQSETEQKKRIALLFDLNKMNNEQKRAIHKLGAMQMSNGGFPWFKDGRYPNTYITNYIASGFGHLQQLGVKKFDKNTKNMLKKAVNFLDKEFSERYEKLLKRAKRIRKEEGKKQYEKFLKSKQVGYFELQYLYMRSFYSHVKMTSKTQKAIDYYKRQSGVYWSDFNLYGKGLIALIQFRIGDKKISRKVLNSLKENSITSEEFGMYWKENTASWYWYQAPIETQALLIEAFSEIENDTKTIDELKVWLLKNKQVSQWKTTKATSEAVYALLLQGTDWVSTTELVDVELGDVKINPTKMPEVQTEAGTGYFKTSWSGNEVTPEMEDVTVTSKGKTIIWGGLYWQYFEDLDKITSAETPLKLQKKLFKKVNSDLGKELVAVTDTSVLKVGDLLTVRIELRADRNLEFVHMKDMRASGVEPINVLSRYKWQDGLGYYESTKDASTNFFFDALPKGVYVFEYDVRVNNAGNFSNGITTVESMYAPEFKSHSQGVRISVKE